MRRRIEDDEDERPARPWITPELVEAVERHVATGHAGVYCSRAIVPELGVTEHLVWVIAHRPTLAELGAALADEQTKLVEWLLLTTSMTYREIAAEARCSPTEVGRLRARLAEKMRRPA